MKKRIWIPLLIILILVGIRIALPYIITDYVNKSLSEIPGYTGSIDDVDLHLYRGAYSIDSLIIDKVEDNNDVPFVSINKIDLSVEWSALFKGALVGEIILHSPTINMVAPNDDDGEFGQDVDWTRSIKELMPIQINRFSVRNGTIHYLDVGSDPKVDLPLSDLQLDITNINNAENSEEPLPSHIHLTATSIGNGSLDIQADANILKPIPDIDLNLEFEEVDLTALNDFLEAYAKIDAEGGVFNLYSEFALSDGEIEGYVKPILTGVKILNLKEKEGNILEVAWEGIVAMVSEVFENQPEDQFASQIPLNGNVNNVDTGIWPAVWNIFRNAFIEAFEKQAGNEINLTNPD